MGALHRSHRLLACSILVAAAACSDDDAASPAATAPTVDEATCRRLAEAAVAPAQDFLDQFSDMTPDELAAMNPPPDVRALQADIQVRARDAVASGCDAEAFQAVVVDQVSTLRGEGEVGETLAAILRGDLDASGVTGASVPREATASDITVGPGDDLASELRRVGPGSTVSFEPGTYAVSETLVVDTGLTLVGAGRDETILESSAAGLALAFTGPGGLELSGLTLRHTGDEEASVMLAIQGPVTVRDVELSGAVAGTEEAGGGHGLAFAFEDLPGFPSRTDEERAGALVVEDVLIADNGGAGLLATGTAAPTITASTFRANGTCGVCANGTAGGRVQASTFEGNQIGIQAGDQSPLVVEGNAIDASSGVGVSIDGASTAQVRGNTITASETSGIQVTGTSRPVIAGNTLRANAVGVLVTDDAEATIDENILEDHDVGVQAGGEATVTARRNSVTRAALAGVSIGESSTAAVEATAITEAGGVGIEVTGTATATLRDNRITGPGDAGLSVTEAGHADGGANVLEGRQVGIQIGGTGTVDLRGDVVTASPVAGVLVTDQAGGTLGGTDVGASATAGVLIGGTSTPTLDGVTVHDGAAGLIVREDARPTITASTLRANAVGLQIEERAAPTFTGNTVDANTDAGVVIAGEAGGTLALNSVTGRSPIGIQVGGTAAPAITGNTIATGGDYGLLYVDAATGGGADNVISGVRFGVHLSGSTSPALTGNTLEVPGVAGIAYTETAGGQAEGNRCPSPDVPGIVLVPTATPTIGPNDCTVGLVQS